VLVEWMKVVDASLRRRKKRVDSVDTLILDQS
jgi:hypothetical protein